MPILDMPPSHFKLKTRRSTSELLPLLKNCEPSVAPPKPHEHWHQPQRRPLITGEPLPQPRLGANKLGNETINQIRQYVQFYELTAKQASSLQRKQHTCQQQMECGGLKSSTEIGNFILPIGAIRGEGNPDSIPAIRHWALRLRKTSK